MQIALCKNHLSRGAFEIGAADDTTPPQQPSRMPLSLLNVPGRS